MGDLSRCHKAAVREVMGAVGMLKDKGGSTTNDILFILDNLHGKVQRHVIQHALRAAVTKGLLNCQNRRYKLCRQRRPVRRSAFRRKSNIRRARVTRVVRDGMCDCNIPVRNFECRAKQRRLKSRPKSPRPKSNSYSFKEVRSLLSCDCCSSATSVSSEVSHRPTEPKTRRTVKRHVRRRYPVPKKILKVEKKDSQEENCGQITDEVKAKTSNGSNNETLQNSSKENLKTESNAKDEENDINNEKASKKERKGTKSTCSAKSRSTNPTIKKSNKNKEADSKSTSVKSSSSQKTDNKTTCKDEEDLNSITKAPSSSKRSKKEGQVKKENLDATDALEEIGYMTRSRAKRRRSKSSKSSKSNHKKSKRNSNKSVSEEKRESDDKDCNSGSKNYDHMYSSLSPFGK